VDGHGCLVIDSSREDLALLARNGRVGVDQLGHHATHGLDTEGQRSDVKQHDVAGTLLIVEDSALDSSTHSDDLIGVDTLGRLFAEVVLHQGLHSRDTAGTTHEDHLIDVARRELSVADSVLARYQALLDQVVSQLLELSTRQRLHQVLRHTALSRDIRQVDLSGRCRAQLDLCLLSSLLQALHSHRILGQIDALVSLEAVDKPVDDHLVEVITT